MTSHAIKVFVKNARLQRNIRPINAVLHTMFDQKLGIRSHSKHCQIVLELPNFSIRFPSDAGLLIADSATSLIVQSLYIQLLDVSNF